MLTKAGCEARQRRLLKRMEADRLDAFVTANYRTVYYLTGNLSAAETPSVLVVWRDGTSLLVTSKHENAVADDVALVELYSIDRVIDEPMADAGRMLRQALLDRAGPARDAASVGIERWATP